ncbi:hypothetical protein PG994_001011 [Apiospora phragmitis]|uniref:Expansin-like EG45 domain-containing protein n=1 Tax=Apiospora phragmitis TaxID=2905665 RepID=A0ABR1WRB4_9PEZI
MQINALQLMPLAASVASAACAARHLQGQQAAAAAPAVAAPAAVAGVQEQKQQAVASPAAQSKQVSAAAGTTGTSTFYGGNLQGGTCSFSTYTLPSGIYGTAFSGSAWDSGAKCGSCLEVTAKGKTIKVMVSRRPMPRVRRGPPRPLRERLEGAVARLLGPDDDVVDRGRVRHHVSLVLHNKSGTSSHWFSMQVVNANEAVAKLEVSTDGGKTWQGTKRQPYNFFENPSGFGVATQTIRVTSASGKTVTIANVGVESDSQIKAASNF